MGNKLRHEGDEVRIKVIWPDLVQTYVLFCHIFMNQHEYHVPSLFVYMCCSFTSMFNQCFINVFFLLDKF